MTNTESMRPNYTPPQIEIVTISPYLPLVISNPHEKDINTTKRLDGFLNTFDE